MNTFLFYYPDLTDETNSFVLPQEESWHIIKVLRFKKSDKLLITNGIGAIFETEILSDSAKGVEVAVLKKELFAPMKPIVRLATSPVKNRETMEWLVEKATEIGVTSLHFFTSEHSERTVLNIERLEKIVISAMKQSLNPYKPELHQLLTFKSLLNSFQNQNMQKLIAHCGLPPEQHIAVRYKAGNDVLLLIGPEGGFSEKEIDEAKCMKFDVVNLGNNRLRTETASIFALTAIQTMNNLQ